MLCDFVIIFHCTVHTQVIHAVSCDDHAKGVTWFSVSMHACGSVPI